MDNKYYTPDISEFYVGFEYEEQVSPGKWVPIELNELNLSKLGKFCLNHLIEIRTRVNYLDSKDIEELGFELSSSQGSVSQYHKYGTVQNYFIIYDDNDRRLIITFLPPNRGKRVIFEGIIKNKSELKVLLKQLGIDA